MINEQLTVHIARPVEEVFAYLAEAGKVQTWQSGLIEFQQLTEGPVQVGTRFREVRRTGPGRTADVQAEITAYEVNRRFATRTITGPRVTVDYAMESEAGGTRLDYQFIMVTRGMMRVLEPLIAGGIRKDTNQDFQTLKRLLEQ